METKTKTFDCLDWKRDVQGRILERYEAERTRWPSFVAFVRDRNERSEFARRICRKLSEEQRARLSSSADTADS